MEGDGTDVMFSCHRCGIALDRAYDSWWVYPLEDGYPYCAECWSSGIGEKNARENMVRK